MWFSLELDLFFMLLLNRGVDFYFLNVLRYIGIYNGLYVERKFFNLYRMMMSEIEYGILWVVSLKFSFDKDL